MSRQDKHKIAATLKTAIHKSKILLSRKFLILIPTAATLGILALVSVLFTSADTASNTYAANLGSQITTEVDGQYYVTLTAPDVNFSVSPSKNENAAKQRIDVNVETNVAGGAKLYLSMAGSSNSLHLNGNTAQSSPVIAAVPDGTDASSFPANTWGYSTDDQTYSAVPTTASDPALLANIDGETTGTTSGSVISASIPVYYAANVDTSIQPGSYSNRMTYSAVVDGGITAEATLTSIKVDGQEVSELQGSKANTILVTTNLMAQPYGTPRVYYRTTSPTGYAECGDVIISSNESGYMTAQCTTTPSQGATGVTLYITPKGSENDVFCADGTYPAGSSQCEMGEWKWGEFTVALPEIIGEPDINDHPSSFSDIRIMQHMTPEICNSASVGDTKQLIDWRDGKLYWVAKLADGNCWMTQNLDLDLVSGQALDADLTDIESDWDPGATTYTVADQGSQSDDNVQSWDPGEAVWKNLSSGDGCYTSTNLYNSSCASYWQNVSSNDLYAWSPMTEYRTDGIVVEDGTYDAHYLAGNYYSFLAATAGTGTSWTEPASSSICPKGFVLPSGRYTYDNFYSLVSQYGLSDHPISGNYSIAAAPLFFVRGGSVSPGGSLAGAGEEGRYWSRNVANGYGSLFTFDASYVYAVNHMINKFVGLSVRCVAATE